MPFLKFKRADFKNRVFYQHFPRRRASKEVKVGLFSSLKNSLTDQRCTVSLQNTGKVNFAQHRVFIKHLHPSSPVWFRGMLGFFFPNRSCVKLALFNYFLISVDKSVSSDNAGLLTGLSCSTVFTQNKVGS